MAIASNINTVIAVADGITTDFTFTWYLDAASSLKVSLWDPLAQTITLYSSPGNYLFNAPPDQFGGYQSGVIIHFINPITGPPAGLLLMQRKVPQSQALTLSDNTAFTAESVNRALDKIVMMVQDPLVKFKGWAYAPPQGGSIHYNLGEFFYNINPQPSGVILTYFGWVCVAPGSPGTWKGFGPIAS